MQIPEPAVLDVWRALLVAHRHLTTALDAELRAGAGLGLDEYDVLYQLRIAGGPLTMSELAGRLLVSRPSATRVVDGLVERGWVGRGDDDRDRRVVLVTLTDAGRRAQSRAGRIHLDGIARHVGEPITGGDTAALAAALGSLATEAYT